MNCNKYSVLFALVFLLFTGCDSTQSSNKPFDSPVPTPTIVPITLEDLESALLTLDDMPTGWTVSPPEEDKEDEDKTTYTFLCMELKILALGSIQSEFNKSAIAPILTHSLSLYPKGLASKAFQDAVSASETCTEWTTPLDDDLEMSTSVTPLSFPMLGEGTLALRGTSKIPIFGYFEVDSIYILVGEVILRITYGEFGTDGIDSEITEAFAREALEKLLSIYPIYYE